MQLFNKTASVSNDLSEDQNQTRPPRHRRHFFHARSGKVILLLLGMLALGAAPRNFRLLAQTSPAARNLALPTNGGVVVSFTSREEKSLLGNLVDGNKDAPGWRSKDGYLPQDIVFAFEKDEIAAIDRLVLNPQNPNDRATWASNFIVSVSTTSPLSGFQEVGQFTLLPEPREQEFAVGKPARFLKLRIVSNGGGPFTSLGKVKILEGSPQLLEELEAKTAASNSKAAAVNEAGVVLEQEPNNTTAEAKLLEPGKRLKGSIDPLGEEDRFRIRVPGSTPSVLSFELLGRPNIRTSLSLLDTDEKLVKRFDPGKIPAQQTAFSWLVNPGEYVVQVTEPVVSMVLIWDTSESMKQSIGDLQKAVETYLDQVRPSERLKLMRFSKDVEVITPEFLNDPKLLKAAAKDKFKPIKGTSLYDAVVKGVDLLDGVPGNRAIVLMTDGSDSSSKLDHPGFWRLLEEKRIRLYTIGLGGGMHRYSPTIGTVSARILSQASIASNGRHFHAQNSDELQGFYGQIASELRTVSTYYLTANLSQGSGNLSVVASGEPIAAVSAPPQMEIILDASGSMNQTIGNRRKIDIAKEVLTQLVQGLPDDVKVALRIYGHRKVTGAAGDCEDSELVVPFGKVDKASLISRVKSVKALGNTPIAFSLRQLVHDFQGVPGEKIVILATDGKEDCNGKPPEAIKELLSQGLKFRLDIIGLAFSDKTSKEEMQQIASMTGGKFHDAKDARSLSQAFQRSLAVPYDVLDAAGAKVADGQTGATELKVPEGIYTVVIHGDKPITIPNVQIANKRSTKVALKKEGQELGIQVHGPK